MILIDAFIFQNKYDGFMTAQSFVKKPNSFSRKASVGGLLHLRLMKYLISNLP